MLVYVCAHISLFFYLLVCYQSSLNTYSSLGGLKCNFKETIVNRVVKLDFYVSSSKFVFLSDHALSLQVHLN